jgi:carbonic anhydrase
MEVLNADEALDQLKQGNIRFQTGQAIGAPRDESRHQELIVGQNPMAVILGCSDSRAASEILFDTRLGDLFNVRVAGNIANQSSIASIEYALVHLGTKLIVVMAHQSCGAVGAAIQGGDAGKNLNQLLSYIEPALDPQEPDSDVIARRHARISAKRLISDSDIIRAATEDDGVKIVTSFLRFTNGAVEFD